MKKKISLILLSLVLAISAITFTACKPDEPTGLTAEQQVQKIKDIYNGAYNAYFNKQASPVNAFSIAPMNSIATMSEDEDKFHEEDLLTFESLFILGKLCTDEIIEQKGTEILTNSFNIKNHNTLRTTAQNELTSISEELAGITAALLEMLSEFNLYGVTENSIYYAMSLSEQGVDIIKSFVKIEYQDESNYKLTWIADFNWGAIKGIGIAIFDSQTRTFEGQTVETEADLQNIAYAKELLDAKESFESNKPIKDLED